MSDLETQILGAVDPFAEANAEDSGAGSEDYVHVRVQQRNGRKCLTTYEVSRRNSATLKDLTKEFCCNGTVAQDPELGQAGSTLMGWKYRVGLFLIGTVVLIWVTSAEVTQSIFDSYRHPFVLTWLGASLLIVYLPISLLNDQIKSCIIKARKNRGTFSVIASTDSPLKSPLKNGRKSSDLELQDLILRKDSDVDFEVEDETASFIRFDNAHPVRNHDKLLSWDLVKVSLLLAPLWFMTEYLSNGALALTSVASTTILSSTAGLFTLVFGTILGQDSFNISKAVAVIMTITGVAMTTLGKTWSNDEEVSVTTQQHSLWGDALGLSSAVSYGLFTILLKKSAGEGGSHVDMQRIFGYIGFFTFFGLWWLIWPLGWLGLEPPFSLPTTLKVDEVLLGNAIVGSVVSDYFWALSVVWTTPLVATLGMSLTIPLAMVADMVVHGRHYSGIYVLGSLQVFAGFVIANLTDQCSRKIGL